MAIYDAFVSAALGHFLIKILQKMFSGQTSLKAMILQIIVSNLIGTVVEHTSGQQSFQNYSRLTLPPPEVVLESEHSTGQHQIYHFLAIDAYNEGRFKDALEGVDDVNNLFVCGGIQFGLLGGHGR
ncbi:MAG: hypothetical protein Q9163_000363 [Psora crenata]